MRMTVSSLKVFVCVRERECVCVFERARESERDLDLTLDRQMRMTDSSLKENLTCRTVEYEGFVAAGFRGVT